MPVGATGWSPSAGGAAGAIIYRALLTADLLPRAQLTQMLTVEISTAARDGRAVLTAANTGPTIPPEPVGRLFQPFWRLEPG